MIGGKSYIANDETRFDQRAGDLAVGVCAFVMYFDTEESHLAKYIATTRTDPENSCERGDDSALDKQMGRVEAHDQSDDWSEWVVDGVTYAADPAIEVGSGSQTPEVGDVVVIKSYQEGETRYLTEVNAAFQLFIPSVTHE